ncbi:MAG: hypothetical protein MRJ68_14945 [Nitrospira sp.]|nr:hypothetical protein [Nitrospira sp.]
MSNLRVVIVEDWRLGESGMRALASKKIDGVEVVDVGDGVGGRQGGASWTLRILC